MATAHVVHFGCRLNQYESTALASGLNEQGLTLVDDIRTADYIIVNTCTVTNRADQKNRSTIRQLHEANPAARIVVTGCYATTDAEELKKLPGVYWVVSNLNKATIPVKIAAEQGTASQGVVDGQFGYTIQQRHRYARATLKIQDGCSRSCSYCKIPQARGAGRSRNFQNSLAEARHLIELGFAEITLTGVNLGWYKGENGETLEDLIEAILNLPGKFILRLSSIEPPEISQRLSELFTHPKMARFLHAPLQSGSATILALMRRGYNLTQYHKRIEQVRKKVADIHLGTDIIVGFPGETTTAFKETLKFCQEMQFANIHVFPFSLRKGTPIEIMLKEKKVTSEEKLALIPGNEIRQRIKELLSLTDELTATYRKQTAGKMWRAVVEKKEYPAKVIATTENYLKLANPVLANLKHGELILVSYDSSGQITSLKQA